MQHVGHFEQPRHLLARLVGLDTSDLDFRRQELYDERTLANREVKALEVQVDNAPFWNGTPEKEVSIVGISAELRAAEELAQMAAAAGQALARAAGVTAKAEAALATDRGRVADLRKALAAAEGQLQADADFLVHCQSHEDVSRAAAGQAQSAVPDTADMRRRLEAAEETNQRVRANRQQAEQVALLEEARGRSEALSARILGVDTEHAARLAAAKFPVPGLGLADGVVTLDGLPFDQASTSARLRVSVAIGLAMNPTLRILLVRDGSLLGAENLRLLAEMAQAADAQVWLEYLTESPDEVQVFIEDGMVRIPVSSRGK